MPIVGFQFDKLSAHRTGTIKGKIDIAHNVNIKDVKPDQINLDKKQDVLKFEFEFKVDYKPGLGNILLEGHLLYLDTPEKIKEIQTSWKKNKRLPDNITTNVINMVLTKSNVKSLILSQDVNLPPQIQLPKAMPKTNTENYIG
ncbi:MAG: hypothetical protein ISS82_00610 [Nanoarchaeota archaeon]|nr:hypothetical protein [Nanoarchaeota archaeon]